ncbi:ABC transporter substrate-binding protein [Amycolatopsis balhimycina DSM 5908]|uniref:ABC transporter substrate-binding protein n=1 Tax=Amycolatopsis balhimycina DSM 5908 TaxID=1081091 RepID=A0A428WP55_AMYBA|nr:ABC transporter substrate-binding protein [Amycolatopsis balhimycina]RSM44861.1 ABC transporter substrate-binding protein [Amycolatopsis balhimycina DSM 5908]
MTSLPNRRRFLAAGAGAALGLSALGATPSTAAAALAGSSRGSGREETRTLDELYRDALAEGGKLVVYAGGDLADSGSGAGARTAFRQRFPEIDLRLIVDYSKYHDVRVDNQLATNTLVPDVVQLQTLQDFTRWKREGRLLHYKPAGFGKLYSKFRDPDGAWIAGMVIAFSYLYDVAAAGANPPLTPLDLVDPRWKGAVASSYPHDDDAVLYLYSLYTETYGWDWIARLAAQNPQFARGSFSPSTAITNKSAVIGIGTGGNPTSTGPVRMGMPDGHPFMAWGQRIAILRKAANPTAAKLYLNWQLSAERQTSNSWSVRTDIAPPAGLKPIWEYPNANVDGFPRFMEDRAKVEQLKQTYALYFGEVKGDPTPGWPGLHPGA